jgi:hypothetical protein
MISVIPPQGSPPIAESIAPTPDAMVRISTGDRRANADGTRSARLASICARTRAGEDIAVRKKKQTNVRLLFAYYASPEIPLVSTGGMPREAKLLRGWRIFLAENFNSPVCCLVRTCLRPESRDS